MSLPLREFELLVRRHNQDLYRACRAILRDDAEAEDAVQAAWINAYRHLDGFRGEASFKTWVTRIAVREALARRRAQGRYTDVPIEEVPMADARDPERDAASEELGRLLEEELDRLPDGMRAVLVLRDVIELDTAETAEALGINEEAVRVRLHRARHAVADRIAAIGEVWRFDGERCDRITARVMSEVDRVT